MVYSRVKSFRIRTYKKHGGGGAAFPLRSDIRTFGRSDLGTCRRSGIPPPVPLQPDAFGATIPKGTRFLPHPGKQLRSSRCLRVRERMLFLVTAVRSTGTVRSGRDCKSCLGSAGWLAIQRRVGKAGSVRLG